MEKENIQSLGQTRISPEEQGKVPLETRNGPSNTEKNSKIIQSKRRHVSFKQDTSKSLNNGKSVDKLLLIPKQIINNQKITNTRKPPLSATLSKRPTEIDGLLKLNTANGKARSKQNSRRSTGKESDDESTAKFHDENTKTEFINPFQAAIDETSKTVNPSSYMEFTLSKFAPGGDPTTNDNQTVDQNGSPERKQVESPKFEKSNSVLSSTELRKSQDSKLSAFYGGIKSPKARFLVNTAIQVKKIKSEDTENHQSPHEVHKLLQENNQLKKENDRKEELIGFLLSALKQKEVTTTPLETPTVTLPEIESYTSPKESNNRYFNFNLHEKPLSAGLGKSNLLVPPKEILNGPKIEAFERNKSQQFSAAFVQPPDFPAFRPAKPVFTHHKRMRSPVLPVFQKAKSIYNFNEMLTIQRGNSTPAYSQNYPQDANAPLLTMPSTIEDGDLHFRDVFLSREMSTKNLKNNISSIQHNLANSRRNLSNLQKFDLLKGTPRSTEGSLPQHTQARKSLNDQDGETFETKVCPANGIDLNATFNPQKCQSSENDEPKTIQPQFVDSLKKPRATLVRKNLKNSSSKQKGLLNLDYNKENAIKVFESYQSSTTKDDNRKEKFPKDVFNINIKKKFFG